MKPHFMFLEALHYLKEHGYTVFRTANQVQDGYIYRVHGKHMPLTFVNATGVVSLAVSHAIRAIREAEAEEEMAYGY